MNLQTLIRVGFLLAALIARPAAKEPPTTSETQEGPEKVSVCQLKSDPAKYNHKLVEVTGFISHGFEDFSLFDPDCSGWPDVWLEYGGTKASDTMYCCGLTPGQTRSRRVSVEGITIPLVEDDRFKEFDKVVRSRGTIMHGKIVGRFFSGQPTKYPKGTSFGGYGHMGCCSLLMIQQVLSLDPHDRDDLDYADAPDQPNITKSGCGFSDLILDWRFDKAIESQRRADAGRLEWIFQDPSRVATEALAGLARVEPGSIKELKQKRQAQGRIVYEWQPRLQKATYMLVLSRPYALTFYASNPKRIAWVVIAAYRSSCDLRNSVTLIK